MTDYTFLKELADVWNNTADATESLGPHTETLTETLHLCASQLQKRITILECQENLDLEKE